MKIKLVRHPYEDYKVGEIIDLGEEKNKSMVEFQRAVYATDDDLKPKKNAKPKARDEKPKKKKPLVDKPVKKAQKKKNIETGKKEAATNTTGKQIEKKGKSKKSSSEKDSFWNKLKE